LGILEEQKRYGEDRVFAGIGEYSSGIKKSLKRWIKNAGINKNISSHCSRHTFACLLLNNGASIYTVSQLMGHRSLNSTLKYEKLTSRAMGEAIDSLPG
jgi:site-specific recombinase XerD